jgi:hypothetical protein
MVRSYAQVRLAKATEGPPALDDAGLSHPTGMRTNKIHRKRGDEGRKRRLRDGQYESTSPEPRVYCPCSLCATRDEPTPRLLSIVEEHLQRHPITNRWKVSNFVAFYTLGFSFSPFLSVRTIQFLIPGFYPNNIWVLTFLTPIHISPSTWYMPFSKCNHIST